MKNLSPKWRSFVAHLGPYVIVIGFLAFINLLTTSYPWVVWPAMGWGVGIAFRFLGIALSEMQNVTKKWRDFAGHFGSYAIIMGLLLGIYLMTDPGGYPWFIWPGAAWGLAVGIHLWSIISDDSNEAEESWQDEQQVAVEEEQAKPQVRPVKQPVQSKVVNKTIQAHLERAGTYREQIEALINATSDERARDRLQELAEQVKEWTAAIEDLAQRVDNFQRNHVILQDIEAVPQAIEKLEGQLAQETDPATKTELERTLTNRKNQLAALEHLQNTMKRAEIKIESTLSSLGTIYSQLLTSQSTDHVADYGRLSAEVDEEVRTLQDHLEALEEVKLGGTS